MKNNISIYIHWPWCNHICNYCDFYRFKKSKNLNYNQILKSYIRDLSLSKKFLISSNIMSINIGGGSPSIISTKLLRNLLEHINKNYMVDKKSEISIEVNPNDLSKKILAEYKDMGINRICIGVQSFDNRILQSLGRPYKKEEAIKSIIDTARYFQNTCIDLIYGTPSSSATNFKEQLYLARNLPLKHISLYEFDFKKIKKPIYVQSKNFFLTNKSLLEEKNFIQYDFNSFSIKGYQSFYGNSVINMEDYLGIGPSSSSRLKYKRKFIRMKNTNNLYFWLDKNKSISKKYTLNKKNFISEFLMLGLSKPQGINFNELEKVTGNDIEKYINFEKILNFEKKKYATFKNGIFFLNIEGLLVKNHIISEIIF